MFFLFSVSVPPQSSVILNERGEVVSRKIHKEDSSLRRDPLSIHQVPLVPLKAFNELSTLILTCDVFGASPSSRVSYNWPFLPTPNVSIFHVLFTSSMRTYEVVNQLSSFHVLCIQFFLHASVFSANGTIDPYTRFPCVREYFHYRSAGG